MPMDARRASGSMVVKHHHVGPELRFRASGSGPKPIVEKLSNRVSYHHGPPTREFMNQGTTTHFQRIPT